MKLISKFSIFIEKNKSTGEMNIVCLVYKEFIKKIEIKVKNIISKSNKFYSFDSEFFFWNTERKSNLIIYEEFFLKYCSRILGSIIFSPLDSLSDKGLSMNSFALYNNSWECNLLSSEFLSVMNFNKVK
jgi:hypothetical protein